METGPVRLSYKSDDIEINITLPWDADMVDMMDAFDTILLGAGFGGWRYTHIQEWLKERLPEEKEGED